MNPLVKASSVLAVMLVGATALASDNLDMKIRCDYKVNDYDETYPVNIPEGQDEAAVTRFRDNQIKLNVSIQLTSDIDEPNLVHFLLLQRDMNMVPKIVVGKNKRAHVEKTLNVKSTITGQGIFSTQSTIEIFEIGAKGQHNSLVCRPLTEAEIAQRQADKDAAAQKAKEEASQEQDSSSEK